MTQQFWKTKTLAEMTKAEWESLCDGCGRCCLRKFEYEDGEVAESRITCKLLDHQSCRCTNYSCRKTIVADCIVLTPENVETIDFLPPTCAYSLLAQGKDLPWWHPLVSGDPETVHSVGVSVRGKDLISELEVDEDSLEEFDEDFLLE
ncbi:MAG: YcgN family cysteine cluster protein [Bradymonadaceae bacterium]